MILVASKPDALSLTSPCRVIDTSSRIDGYRIGDLAAPVVDDGTYACGRPPSSTGRIEDRTRSVVHCADGTRLPATRFAHFFDDYADILRQFQVYWERPGQFTLRVISLDPCSDAAERTLIGRIVDNVDSGARIEVGRTESIPMVRTCRRAPPMSLVNQDFQAVQRTPERV